MLFAWPLFLGGLKKLRENHWVWQKMTKNDKKMTKKSQKKLKKTRKKGSKNGHFFVEKKMKKNGSPRIPGEVLRSAEKRVIFLLFKTPKSRGSKIGPKSVKTQGHLTKTWSGWWTKTKKTENDGFGGPKSTQNGSFFYHHMTGIFVDRGFGRGLTPPDPKMAIWGGPEKMTLWERDCRCPWGFLSKMSLFEISQKSEKTQKITFFKKWKKLKKWPKKVKFFFRKNHEKKKFQKLARNPVYKNQVKKGSKWPEIPRGLFCLFPKNGQKMTIFKNVGSFGQAFSENQKKPHFWPKKA